MPKHYPMTRLTVLALAGAACLSSCQQFFTTSLAAYMARDSYTIPADITVDEAEELLAEALAVGDADIAAALVDTFLDAATEAAAADPESAAYDEAASALLDAVILSSEVGSVLTEAIETAANGGASGTDYSSIIDSVASVTLTDDETAALILLSENPPDDMSSTEALSAALSLIGDEYESADIETLVNDLSSDTPTTVLTEGTAVYAAYEFITFALAADDSLLGMFGG